MNGDFQLNNCDNDNRIELINTALLIRPINKLSTIHLINLLTILSR